jgi:hypothetical protein
VCLVAITALGTSANKTFGTVSGQVASPGINPESTAREFVNDLCAGLTQAAWDDTSADFHSRHLKVAGPDQSKFFMDFIQEHPGLRAPASIEVKSQNTDPIQPTFQATVTPKTGAKIILNLKLKMEMGSWKVNDIAVLEEEKKKDSGKVKQAAPKDVGKDN